MLPTVLSRIDAANSLTKTETIMKMSFRNRRILLNVVGVGRTAEVYDCQRSGVEGETETDAQHASEFVCFLLFSLNMSAEKLIHVFRLVGS